VSFVNDSQRWMMAFSIFSDRSRAMTPAKQQNPELR
jgi:hypothetical protein